MRRKVLTFSASLAFLFALALLPSAASARTVTARERHPQIRKAINALEAARGDLQSAAHDFCGHREAALQATNAAIDGLRLALQYDRASLDNAPLASDVKLVNAAYAPERFERHPRIRAAIKALEAARNDLQHAAHDFGGHRARALEVTNGAIEQLRLALACDRR